MKRIDLIIRHEHFLEVNELLRKHEVGGMTFHSVKGRGRSRQEEIAYGGGIARTVPEFVTQTKIEVMVPDSIVKPIIDEIRAVLSKSSFPSGKIFVSDIVEAYSIDAERNGDAAL